MSDNPYKPPLTHAERGALGGAASNPAKGFGSPSVLAKALATREANAEAKRAVVKAITDQFDSAHITKVPETEILEPYKSKPFVSALADPHNEIQVIE